MRDIVIELFDVVPYLEDKRVSFVNEGSTQGWINLNCPWCSDSADHLGIHLDSNSMNCWRCGKKGSVLNLVKILEGNCSYSETLAVMEKYQNPSRFTSAIQEEIKHPGTVKLPSIFQKIVWPTPPDLVKKFLLFRGFDPEEICRNKELYFGGHVGKFKFRLILPITYHHRMVSYVGRELFGRSSVPYLSLEDKDSVIPPKSVLYGYDEVPPGGNIVIVEGPLDQWKLGPGAVATFGTAWTMDQVSMIRNLTPNKVFILYDTEDIAQKAAKALCDQIWFCECEVMYLEDKKDPGELSVEEGREVMNQLV